MKKFIIIALSIVSIMAFLLCYLKYKRKESIVHNQYYVKEKIFQKDSENRGYSDRAKNLMEEELQIFNNDPVFRTLFDKTLKQERLVVLSENKEEYMKRFNRWSQLKQCIMVHYIRNYGETVKFKNWLKSKDKFESPDMNILMEAVDSEFSPMITSQDSDLMFKRPNDEECEAYKNE